MYWIEQAKKEYEFLVKCHNLMMANEAGLKAFHKALRNRLKALEKNTSQDKRGDQLHSYAEQVAARFVLEEIEDNVTAAGPESELLRVTIVGEEWGASVPF